ncbi:MAG TPA: LuxR C-terminal-related transcriptional regulator, partial [bacterium]|nr:LuxR C-terminal-related transcriptional regulator [bacterium]
GVWLVDLGPLFDPTLVPRTVAASLALPEQPEKPILATLKGYLQVRRLLLILDNCEHLIGASAELAEALLQACPDVRILATSRETLGIAGESVWRAPSLSAPGSGESPSIEYLREYEAVQLFEARAAAVCSDFRVTAENAAAVAQICRRLDGIPLAIELAAARIRVLPVEQLVAKLDDRFRVLTGGSRTALPRQQTLRAAMDWSYDLLPERERLLLRRLSVFAGGWTLEAAETICAGGGIESPDVLDLLTKLVDKSLVVVQPPRGEARYRLLETVRQYARDWLVESEETAEVRGRHRDWFLALVERTHEAGYEPVWHPPGVLERLDRDHENLRAALGWSATEKAGAEPGLRLAGALAPFWHNRGYYAEGRRWLEGALVRCHEASPAARARALGGASLLAWRQADYEPARQLAERLVALGREQGDKAATTHGLIRLGLIVGRGYQDFPRATVLFEEALTLARELGDRKQIAHILANLSATARHQGDYDRAAVFAEESLTEVRAFSSSGGVGYVLRHLGHIRLAQGYLERAAKLYAESLRSDAVPSFVVIECLEGLAGVAGGRGQHQRAARLFGAADAVREAIGFPRRPPDNDHHERAVASVRSAFGDAAFETAVVQGRSMGLDDAVAYALTDPGVERRERAGGEPGTAAKDQGPLTARECEVAALIARGLTNREIASTLFISERTADAHVRHILDKLGFGSRTQIAAWAVEHGLPAPSSAGRDPA